ncbi:hypothetical protein NLJ89_g8100 [Agrocybe chaxingu]|uniref:Nudix hydrolase domain-containing protein n=1 Tax=Agrocybe chaxingu TaxID=84603 RepID=A0A9W8JW35_9AGAR|nr:hypothetical protein NLJ89_g8100 [Agrocybe chaxingu]
MQSSRLASCARRTILTSPTRFSKQAVYQRKFNNLLRLYHVDFAPPPSLSLPRGHHSLLPLVYSCNNLILPRDTQRPTTVGTRTAEGDVVNEEHVIPFLLSQDQKDGPVGYLRAQVASALEEDHQKHLVSGAASPWDLRYSREQARDLVSVAFAPWVNEGGKYTRTMHMERIVYEWKKHGLFKEILRGWSDEAYPVYSHAPKQLTSSHDPVAFAIERAALPLFGLVNFGASMAYTRDPLSGRMMIWIPRRSPMKRTWPGKLDVTVGGGMGLGDTALETIVRESAEEALLDQDYVTQYIRSVGVLPFPNRSPGGWILPGMYYLFDLPLPIDGSLIPKTNALDGEVETFELQDVDQVLKNLLEGQFKSSSALAIVDFLIRHGYVTEDTDPRFMEVCRLLKPEIKLPGVWKPYP